MQARFCFLSIFLLSLIGGCYKQQVTGQEVGKKFSIAMEVSGMTCESCSRSIKNTLSQNPAIKNIEIKVKEGFVSFELAANSDLTEQKIKSFVSDLGYKVKSFRKDSLENKPV